MKNIIKTFITVLFVVCANFGSYAQEVSEKATHISQQVTNPMNFILLFSFVILLSTILVLIRIIRMLTDHISGKPALSDTEVITKTSPTRISFWSKINRKYVNDAIPVEREADVLLDHDYDGIKELDNNLPPWWKYGFYLTIIVSVIYLVQYHVVGKGSVQLNEYNEQLAEAELQKQERLKETASMVDETTVTQLSESGAITEGQKIFTEKCIVCHGKSGEGNVGPNLTDDYWLHGGQIKDIFKVIKYGVTSKGMLAWQGQLSPVQIQQVSSYIKSIHNTNPPNAKAPQGDLFSEEGSSKQESGDSTNAAPRDSSAIASIAK